MQELSTIIGQYGSYLQEIAKSIEREPRRMATLAELIDESPVIHLFGFGRSGTAALAMAIRLRHFLSPEKQVFWLGDQVRDPIRKGDLVILFSRSGDRKEVLFFLEQAHEKKARTIAILLAEKSPLAHQANEKVILPAMDGDIVYGGGDFEMAAWYFQEIFLTYYGSTHAIPKEKVGQNHI